MKLSVRGMMFAVAFFWAVALAVVGVLNILYPGYGADYLRNVTALYPWYKATGTPIDLIYGVVSVFVAGLFCGLIFVLLYNLFAGKGKKAAPRRAAARRAPARKRPAAKRKRPTAKRKRPAAKRKRPAAKRKRPAAKKRRR
jgi:hypothetical protein